MSEEDVVVKHIDAARAVAKIAREDFEKRLAEKADYISRLERAVSLTFTAMRERGLHFSGDVNEAVASALGELMTRALDASRVCDKAGCTAAVVRRDDGSRTCSLGHESKWVLKSDLQALKVELAKQVEAREAVERALREVVILEEKQRLALSYLVDFVDHVTEGRGRRKHGGPTAALRVVPSQHQASRDGRQGCGGTPHP